MAFGSRYSLLTVFLIAGIAFAVLFAGSLVFALAVPSSDGTAVFFESRLFWFSYDLSIHGVPANHIGVVVLFATGCFGLFRFRGFFRRFGQAEIFFLALFFFSLIPESLRLTIVWLRMGGLPPLYGVLFSRLIYSARIFGLLSLFFGSLYALDFQYQKFEIVLVIMLLISFLFTFSLPFDGQLLLTDGLYKLSDEQGMFIVTFSLMVLIIVNYSVSAVRVRNATVLIGLVLLFAGREMLCFAHSPVMLAGAVVLFAGGVFVSGRGYEQLLNVI